MIRLESQLAGVRRSHLVTMTFCQPRKRASVPSVYAAPGGAAWSICHSFVLAGTAGNSISPRPNASLRPHRLDRDEMIALELLAVLVGTIRCVSASERGAPPLGTVRSAATGTPARRCSPHDRVLTRAAPEVQRRCRWSGVRLAGCHLSAPGSGWVGGLCSRAGRYRPPDPICESPW